MYRNGKKEKGIQLTELAIILPILMALLAAIAEFGNYFYYYTTLSKATRAGARYLSSRPYTDGEKAKAKNLMVCGNPSDCSSSTPILPGFSASNIQVTASGGTTYLPNTITVSIVSYNYSSLFNLNLVTNTAGSWASIAVDPSTTMRYLLEN
jgi:Flp pilus assembly protein TadG